MTLRFGNHLAEVEEKMKSVRKIRKVWKSKPTLEGAGVHLKRAFGYNQVPLFDPFLLLGRFPFQPAAHYLKGFPWHPHRGIETITYVIQGRVEHGDSMGNKGVIAAGDVQWMTAGSGIIHQEMPKGDDDGLMWGFQLWANLPASHKMMAPRYRGIVSGGDPGGGPQGRHPGQSHLWRGRRGKRTGTGCGGRSGLSGRDGAAGDQLPSSDQARAQGLRLRVSGEGYFDPERSAYAHEVVGENYFDMKRQCACNAENLILYEDGDEVVDHHGGTAGPFSAGIRKADRRTGGLVWPDRHEHPGGAATCL